MSSILDRLAAALKNEIVPKKEHEQQKEDWKAKAEAYEQELSAIAALLDEREKALTATEEEVVKAKDDASKANAGANKLVETIVSAGLPADTVTPEHRIETIDDIRNEAAKLVTVAERKQFLSSKGIDV